MPGHLLTRHVEMVAQEGHFRGCQTARLPDHCFCDRAMQTHGGMGYAREYHVERYWREARLMKIAPVSQEMVCNYISSQVLGLPKSY